MKRGYGRYLLVGLVPVLLSGCTKKEVEQSSPPPSQPGTLRARTFNSGFELAHDTDNGMLAASDGKIYRLVSRIHGLVQVQAACQVRDRVRVR